MRLTGRQRENFRPGENVAAPLHLSTVLSGQVVCWHDRGQIVDAMHSHLNQSRCARASFHRGGSFLEVTSRMLQLGGGSALVLRLLLARATMGLGGQAKLDPNLSNCNCSSLLALLACHRRFKTGVCWIATAKCRCSFVASFAA